MKPMESRTLPRISCHVWKIQGHAPAETQLGGQGSSRQAIRNRILNLDWVHHTQRPPRRNRPCPTYSSTRSGFLRADLWVNDYVIVELKVAKAYVSDDEPQLLNELKSSRVILASPMSPPITNASVSVAASDARKASRTGGSTKLGDGSVVL
jgi:hypothetical protein